ncbi:tyrosine-type recombinase/integrase [Nonomuraea dietziae]|uniref:tyrosine-type recombinase/integrase n=1 Tax=Nonomuraea dietziae TaxID=65515 RepID=UPI003449B45F
MGEIYRLQAAVTAAVAPTFEQAVTAFLNAHAADPGAWSTGTAKKYRETFAALGNRLDASVAACLAQLDGPDGSAAFATAFGAAFKASAPATYARHLSAVRSAVTWWRGLGWVTGDPTGGLVRPKIPLDTTRALTRAQIDALFRVEARVREKTLWRLLYESAARADEVLNLDVPDLDLANKRGRALAKGGNLEWIHWQTGTALLLPRLLASRTVGPVFLADRKPVRAVALTDLCPVTGRARLSYRRAEEIFEQTTRALANPGASKAELAELRGWTLHQLRHSRLTHEAENGTNTPTLLVISRHASVRSLERYARPGVDAVAAHVAATDLAARRRH